MNESVVVVVSAVEWVMEISNEGLLVVAEHSSLAVALILTEMNQCLTAIDRFVLDSIVN
jgi:hypothetical protein